MELFQGNYVSTTWRTLPHIPQTPSSVSPSPGLQSLKGEADGLWLDLGAITKNVVQAKKKVYPAAPQEEPILCSSETRSVRKYSNILVFILMYKRLLSSTITAQTRERTPTATTPSVVLFCFGFPCLQHKKARLVKTCSRRQILGVYRNRLPFSHAKVPREHAEGTVLHRSAERRKKRPR